jgi:predicted N-acetyltransferase YhbS
LAKPTEEIVREPTARRSYAEDPGLAPRLFPLLEQCFPGFASQEQSARAIGMRWEEASTPFIHEEGGEIVSHVGLLPLPLLFLGREVEIGGIHAVATHPAHRRRGHYRRLMEEALAFAGERYATLQLTTAAPALYTPFGFRIVEEHRFVGALAKPASAWGMRPLDLSRPDELSRLTRLLDARTPVSERLGAVRERAVFLFNEARRPIYYADDLDIALSLELAGGVLRLFDVVAEEIPPLSEISARVGAALSGVEVYFSPDKLGAALRPERHALGGDDNLMVRGPYPPEPLPVMLPRTARC